MLPFMMHLSINDILFFVTSIKNPTKSFNMSHSLQVRQGHHFTLNLFIICVQLTVLDIFILINFHVSGTLFLLFLLIRVSVPLNVNLKSFAGVILYLTLTLIIHVLFV